MDILARDVENENGISDVEDEEGDTVCSTMEAWVSLPLDSFVDAVEEEVSPLIDFGGYSIDDDRSKIYTSDAYTFDRPNKS